MACGVVGALTTMTAPRRRRRGRLAIVVGLLILLLPIVVTVITDMQLRERSEAYARAVPHASDGGRGTQLWDEAQRYNAALAAGGHHALPPVASSPGFEEYLRVLDIPETGNTMARLRIPAIGVDLPIYHTTSSSVLYRGVGHMFGSDVPVGGQGRTSVLSAHTGMVNATMFDNLPRLDPGADIYVDILGRTLHYRVVARHIVKPDDTQSITYEQGLDKLILITCTPYGLNTDRLLVETVRVDDHDEASPLTTAPAGVRLSWWMWIDIALIVLVLLYLAWRRRRDKDDQGLPKSSRNAESASSAS